MHLSAYNHHQPTTHHLPMVLRKVRAVPEEGGRAQETRTVTTTLCEIWRIARWKKASWVKIIGSEGKILGITFQITKVGLFISTEMR